MVVTRTIVPSLLRSSATSLLCTRQSCSITSRGSTPARSDSDVRRPIASASTSKECTKTSHTPISSSFTTT